MRNVTALPSPAPPPPQRKARWVPLRLAGSLLRCGFLVCPGHLGRAGPGQVPTVCWAMGWQPREVTRRRSGWRPSTSHAVCGSGPAVCACVHICRTARVTPKARAVTKINGGWAAEHLPVCHALGSIPEKNVTENLGLRVPSEAPSPLLCLWTLEVPGDCRGSISGFPEASATCLSALLVRPAFFSGLNECRPEHTCV